MNGISGVTFYELKWLLLSVPLAEFRGVERSDVLVGDAALELGVVRVPGDGDEVVDEDDEVHPGPFAGFDFGAVDFAAFRDRAERVEEELVVEEFDLLGLVFVHGGADPGVEGARPEVRVVGDGVVGNVVVKLLPVWGGEESADDFRDGDVGDDVEDAGVLHRVDDVDVEFGLRRDVFGAAGERTEHVSETEDGGDVAELADDLFGVGELAEPVLEGGSVLEDLGKGRGKGFGEVAGKCGESFGDRIAAVGSDELVESVESGKGHVVVDGGLAALAATCWDKHFLVVAEVG